MTPTTPVLAAEGISKAFGPTQALSDVSVSVSAGSVLALVGENGAGKSTLVKIMSGVVAPDEGAMLVDGVPVAFPDARSAATAGIHLVHQELALLPERTVVENIFLGSEERSRYGLLRWAPMRERATEALERLGIHDIDPDTRVRNLSTGNQQMVEIARTLVRKARVVILDEPTAALSPAEAEHLFAVIRSLKAHGTAFIYISHRLDEVLEMADTITVLKDGQHVLTDDRTAMTVERIITSMVGRKIEDLFPARDNFDRPARPLVEITGLADPPVVRHASLELYPGEIVGLYGLEGHGQDELLACLAGARRPLRGTLTLSQERMAWRSVGTMISAGFGYVPEDRKTEGLLLNLTGVRNITLPILRTLSTGALVSARKERVEAAKAAQAAGVRGQLDRTVSALSGGNQQKVVLARWLAAGSRVLLLNQPTRGVDVGSKSEIYHLIRRVCRDHGAVALVVSREITELQGLCDRILVMSHGELRDEHHYSASEKAILVTAVGS